PPLLKFPRLRNIAKQMLHCSPSMATAVDLARRGARVILACRDKAKGESAESGNSEVILMILDLASLNSVRAFAQSFLASEPRLDILINNAGVFQAGQTADGFDLAFQVNHLSHFLLTHLLLDQLKCCAPSRIVILSSSAHTSAKFNFGTLKKPNKWMMKGAESYCNSKLANILHARELAKRLEGTNVTCYVVHPGEWKSRSKAPQMEPPLVLLGLRQEFLSHWGSLDSLCRATLGVSSIDLSCRGRRLPPCQVQNPRILGWERPLEVF
uniref:Uncharacterized protein n=1 Tax=Laticauda laticaudata TaxID=8630 RepID=A0A8C5RYG0_LATLA